MDEERKEQRRFESAMRELGFGNEKLTRPINPLIYFHTETRFAWKVWQAAKRDSK